MCWCCADRGGLPASSTVSGQQEVLKTHVLTVSRKAAPCPSGLWRGCEEHGWPQGAELTRLKSAIGLGAQQPCRQVTSALSQLCFKGLRPSSLERRACPRPPASTGLHWAPAGLASREQEGRPGPCGRPRLATLGWDRSGRWGSLEGSPFKGERSGA